MDPFDFVTGADFKAALLGDYREMQVARGAGAWKSVHVLAGSIVEAVLVDFIASSDIPQRRGFDPLTLDLGGAIKICREEHILSDRTATLSDVIRSYRNLIHPGRVIRLAEFVDENSASVASALVEMIISEVGKAQAETRGYTAEQLVGKMESDPSAASITKHLLADMSSSERERLLLVVLPTRCLDPIRSGAQSQAPDILGTLYRAAYDASGVDLQKKATEQFVRVLREEPVDVVAAFETAFFRAGDLKHVAKGKQSMLKAHLIDRLRTNRSEAVFRAAKGISPYLSSAELETVVDAIVTEIAYGMPGALDSAARDSAARELLLDVYQLQPAEADAVLLQRLEAWVKHLRDQGHGSLAGIEALRAEYGALVQVADLPF